MTNENSKAIEDFASLQFTDNEIALIMNMDIDDLIDKFRSDIDRGRLLAEAEVRRAILTMAKQGSTPAQKQFMDLNKDAKLLSSDSADIFKLPE